MIKTMHLTSKKAHNPEKCYQKSGQFMLKNKNISFYAPIKPPDHHIPSGDRLIAQNIFKALKLTHANVELASRYIAYSKRHDPSILDERKKGALDEADRLIADYKARSKELRPHLWLTYHPYCKAPDWIGARISDALGIPYVTIEAAKTGQGGKEDFWKPWREEAQAGIITANRHLVFKPTDWQYLSNLLNSENNLSRFNPFIDAENIEPATPMALPDNWDKSTPVLITTGMMRKGKKVENFNILAEALKGLGVDFNLIIVGGGPEEDTIKEAFSHIDKAQLHWTGLIEHAEVLRWMRSSDIFIWPGWKEPIGMVYLEAQLQELPVIAFKSMGVPLVVEHNSSGYLVPENDIMELRAAMRILLTDQNLRKNMGKNGRAKVLAEHGINAAAESLDQILSELL